MAKKRNGTTAPPVVDNPQGDSPANSNGEEKRQPVEKIRMRNVTVAIWRNESDRGPWFAVTLSRSYRDEKGDWHTSVNFAGPDLLILAEVARAAFLRIVEMTQAPSAPATQPTEEIPL